jgi:hypothetical protein
MGSATGYECRSCGARFQVEEGGGFFFDLLHCDACGATWSIGHEELGDAHLGYVKGLGMPYAMARAENDARIQREYPGPVLSEAEYHAAVEARAGRCPCGGSFRYAAPARCPTCRSTVEQWTPTGEQMFYD